MENEKLITKTVEIIKQAGEIALRYYKNPFTGYDLKPDGSHVTIADKEIEIFIKSKLEEEFEGIVIGEEGNNNNLNLESEFIWAVDPIDGTHSYAMKLPGWCISIGLLKDKKPYFGLIYSPIFDELYYGGPDFGAFLNYSEINSCVFNREDLCKTDSICIDSKSMRNISIKFPGKLRSFGSTALHLVFAAKSSVLAAHCGKVKIWDILGAVSICYASGLCVKYIDGEDLFFDYDILNGKPLKKDIIACPSKAFKILSQCFKEKK
ncbi:MAG: inositol monophosphatase [Candidatus Muirbacterium halophilum]|nr:inositol monophosphatase [Candidatus Muirbacterium halophilum]MCK9474356.1 inositol monophosphatase [Candidatus Muirbacterium halophilum]